MSRSVLEDDQKMASHCSTDFGQLYRRALAERDPVMKDMLLQQVQSILDAWGKRDSVTSHPMLVMDSEASAELARPVRNSASRAPQSRAS